MLAILNLLPIYWQLPRWVVDVLNYMAFTPLSSIYCELAIAAQTAFSCMAAACSSAGCMR